MGKSYTPFSADKMYTYLKGYAMGAGMTETLKALAFAREKHKDQLRKDGEPYIIHPLTMACNAIALEIKDDILIAAILLHDVVEDCDIYPSELPVSNEVRDIVQLLTFRPAKDESKTLAKIKYYDAILGDVRAVIAKAIDRCHNVSSMAGTFTKEKLEAYIVETREHVLPMLKAAKNLYPNESNIIFILRYHMISVVDSIEATLQTYETVKVTESNI